MYTAPDRTDHLTNRPIRFKLLWIWYIRFQESTHFFARCFVSCRRSCCCCCVYSFRFRTEFSVVYSNFRVPIQLCVCYAAAGQQICFIMPLFTIFLFLLLLLLLHFLILLLLFHLGWALGLCCAVCFVIALWLTLGFFYSFSIMPRPFEIQSDWLYGWI